MKDIKQQKFEVGTIVSHKARSSWSTENMIILRIIDENRVECRYFNDAQKKFTIQEFYTFELFEIAKRK